MAIMLGTRGVSAEMNVTPLVDVLLVLLVIFMLITPPTDPYGLDAKLPQDSPIETPAKQLDQTIVLRVMRGVGEEASIRINREEVTWADLRVRLRDIYKTRATKIMFIHGDEQIEFSQVARAIDLAREADPTIAIGLVTKEIAGD